ncbi:MAG TPA: ATP-binding protein, partial [Kofleriaceae bacterium]|nr:ATP-binding protein [Kofleriaceae bacterium]
REPTDLAAIVRTVAATLAASQPERVVEMVCPDTLLVTADPRLLQVIVTNLVGNAWKFTGNVAHARIEVGEIQCDGARAFYVRDNGAGFAMAHAANLFGPFQRMHTVREFAGTGIGLATAQRIVHRHGGRIWAESAVDAGATFYFTLESAEDLRT